MSDNAELTNKRRLKRHTIEDGVLVRDEVSGKDIGKLVNMHSEGLMVMGDVALVPENLYQLSLYLPEPIDGHAVVGLGVDCLWVRDSGSDSMPMYWSGCQIIDCSTDARRVIEKLIESMGEH